MISCTGNAQTSSKEKKTIQIEKTDTEWKKVLSPATV